MYFGEEVNVNGGLVYVIEWVVYELCDERCFVD